MKELDREEWCTLAFKNWGGSVYEIYDMLKSGYLPNVRPLHAKQTPTWTRADQESGVLPPVGAEVLLGGAKCIVEAINIRENQLCVRDVVDSELGITYMQYISPIETPEEKAKRLEDEFVASLLSEDRRGPLSMIHAGYAHGVIDAYRKIKAEGFKND